MNAILCENLTRTFGAVRAVDGVSFAIPAGCVFTLLGANGAGKTTTIHLLLGLLAPSTGRASVLGLDPRGHDGENVRARCGVLLEHHGLYERLTAEENLQFYARVARMSAAARERRVRELLEHYGLWERRCDRVGTFSRGMKQKLAIARAMLHAPPIVFLDEPTAGLDPEAVVGLRRDIASLASDHGVTVFLNTHNITDAEKLSNLVGVMRRGKLLAMGTPAELQGDTIVTVVGTGMSQQHAHTIGATLVDGGLQMRLRAGEHMAPIVRELVARGVAIEEVRKERAGLESTFLSLVSEESS
jgi:ABC-2 type transport system ATP-binding protein